MEEIVESGAGVSDTAVSDAIETDSAEKVDDKVKCGAVGDDSSEEVEKASSAEEEKSFLEREIVRLKDEIVRQKAEFDAAVEEMKVRSAVMERLYGVGAKNPKLLVKLIDCSKVGFGDDGGLVGLEEQIGALKEKEGYLFEERSAGSLGCFRPEESGDLAETGVDFSQMTYSEMIRAIGR